MQGDGKRRDADRARVGADRGRLAADRARLGALEDLAHRGGSIGGPPWILGLRGSPIEAPENTLASFRRALDLGLDGIAYDVRACATGEAVLLRDPTIDRTTDGAGRLADKTLPDLAALDAGGWFRARFRGERLALLEEALDLDAADGRPEASERRKPRHLLWLREPGLVPEVARILGEFPKTPALVASSARETCLEARDAGLAPMLILPAATEDARAFVRDERIAACAVESGGFGAASDEAPERNDSSAQRRDSASQRSDSSAHRGDPQPGKGDSQAKRSDSPTQPSDWPTERWTIGTDSPAELLEACRAPLAGIATREPLRALALRALCALAPDYRGPHPILVPELEIQPDDGCGASADWRGSWTCAGEVTNPFPFAVDATAGLVPRHGAFETEGLPRRFALAPGASERVEFGLAGGSWRVGGDPLFFVLYRWKRARGRPAGKLLLDAPLARVRTAIADALAQRLTLLRESPSDPPASLVLRRRGRDVFVAIENAGGLEEPHTLVYLDGRFHRGGRGVRARLPAHFDARREGVPFSCGIEGRADGERVVRRYCGGIPDEDGVGSPGRLKALASA